MDDRDGLVLAQAWHSAVTGSAQTGPAWRWQAVAAKARELFGPSPEMLAVVETADSMRENYGGPTRDWNPVTRKLLEAVDVYRLTLQPPKRYTMQPHGTGTGILDNGREMDLHEIAIALNAAEAGK